MGIPYDESMTYLRIYLLPPLFLLLPMTLLIFFATATWTWIVASCSGNSMICIIFYFYAFW
jgi:hypothetical protein